MWARLILKLGVVGWGPVDGCWWCAEALIVQICMQRAVGPLDDMYVDWLVCSSEGIGVVSWAGAVGAKFDDDGGS